MLSNCSINSPETLEKELIIFSCMYLAYICSIRMKNVNAFLKAFMLLYLVENLEYFEHIFDTLNPASFYLYISV